MHQIFRTLANGVQSGMKIEKFSFFNAKHPIVILDDQLAMALTESEMESFLVHEYKIGFKFNIQSFYVEFINVSKTCIN